MTTPVKYPSQPGPELAMQAINVHKYFKGAHILKGVDLSVRRGEVVCIIGPSGAGKSTFLRCINHLEPIQEGRIWANGHLVGYQEVNGRLKPTGNARVARQRRDIGMVFQSFNLFWHMTLLENIIEAPMRVLGKSRAEAIATAHDLLEKVGLSNKADAYPRRLSGGQQQRGAIARALAMNPRLMLFDEPTSALDPETIGEVLKTMEQLAREGMTMIVVTHEMGFAKRVANRVVMMDDGVVIVDEETKAFFEAPKEQRHRDFLSKLL